MKQKFILRLFWICLFAITANSAMSQVMVSGTVRSSTDEKLAGVTVLLKGSTTGVFTDDNGKYTITVPNDNSVLVFSFLGLASKEINVNKRTSIDVVLEENTVLMDEVVVTALGISREKKSLGYAVGEVSSEKLTQVAQENALNSLAGKVAGVQVSSTGSAGSSVSVIIRGATSLAGDNQPLFVIDGVPVNNSLSGNVTQMGHENTVDYGNAISDLNSDDIEKMSILKGPSAAALYGSRAANGVILITTKSGKKGKKPVVSITNSTVFDKPFRFLEMNTRFATGLRAESGDKLVIDEGSAGRLGALLDVGNKAQQWSSPIGADGKKLFTDLLSYPDNTKNFVQTGHTINSNISVEGGGENSVYRVSFTNMTSEGMIPNSDLTRNTFNVSGAYDVTKNIKLSTNVTIGRSESDNRPSGDRGTNPMEWAYKTSPHTDIRSLKNYWVEENVQQLSPSNKYNNPYFLAYAVNNSFFRDRVYGNVKLDWDLTSDISVMGRYSLDVYNEQRETKIPWSYSSEPKGGYGLQKIYELEQNIDFLATYKKRFSDFSANASIGGNYMYRYGSSLVTASQNRGQGLTIPGLYNISNISKMSLNATSYYHEKAIYSLYGLVSLGYKDIAYLDLTARNDWSSTLPENNRSYFYPSASASILVNNIVELPKVVDLTKIRVGVAQVGNDTEPYRLTPVLLSHNSWGGVSRLGLNSNLLAPDLKPEIATSIETGLDLVFLKDRLRVEATWYQVDNKNQILSLSLPSSSGYGSKLINAGKVQSRGIELSIGGTPIKTKDWTVDLNVNYSRNRTKILELADGIEYFNLWTAAKGGAYTWVGEEIGNIYDVSIVRVTDKDSPYYNWPLLNSSGELQAKTGIENMEKIGNFNPNFTMGFQGSVNYKRFRLDFSIDWRNGGDFISQTYRYFDEDMKASRFMDEVINPLNVNGNISDYLKSDPNKYIKNGMTVVGGPTKELGGYNANYSGWVVDDGVFIPGVIGVYDADGKLVGYNENLGGDGTKVMPMILSYQWDFTRPSLFDASFIKLRDISLSYDVPTPFVKKLGMNKAVVSVYSRNLMLWTKAGIGIDPETAFQPNGSSGTFQQGVERFNVTPWAFSMGFKVALVF